MTVPARLALAVLLGATTPLVAAELPVTGSFRDVASCEAVRTLAGEETDTGAGDSTDASALSDEDRALLADAVQDGVTMDAARIAGPGGWVCSVPQVWEVRAGDRWLALAACEAGSDFFPAVLTLERLEEARYRLRLGDGGDAVEMIPCEVEAPEAPSEP